MPDQYRHVLSPGRIGSMTLRNRIVMTAMGSNQAELDGTCGQGIRAYYEERAKGGVGLIIIEAAAIAHPMGTVTPRQKFGKGLPIVRRWVVLDKLRRLDATLIPEARDIRIGVRPTESRRLHGGGARRLYRRGLHRGRDASCRRGSTGHLR